MADVEKQAQAAEAKSRKDRPTGSIHFGDPGYDEG